MRMKAEDGKLYAEITLRDVVEKNDVSDMPLLAEVKRLYDENAKLRELVRYMHRCYVSGHDWGPWGAPEKQHVEDIMRELGIEVKE